MIRWSLLRNVSIEILVEVALEIMLVDTMYVCVATLDDNLKSFRTHKKPMSEKTRPLNFLPACVRLVCLIKHVQQGLNPPPPLFSP
jgi:hypothetical protein